MLKNMIKSGATALTVGAMALAPATFATFASVTTADAQKGGNGNGNGNGNSRSERGNNGNGNSNSNREAGNRGNNGRGAIASELKSLNAAHASPTALANASPNSMPGKLYAYQQASIAVSDADALIAEKGELYTALESMTEERFNELNPDLDYATTLAATAAEYQAAVDAKASAQATTDETLAVLTDGRELSDAAMAELHRMLGL